MILNLLLIIRVSLENQFCSQAVRVVSMHCSSMCLTGVAGNWFEFSKERYIATLTNV